MKFGAHAHMQSKVGAQVKGHVEPVAFTASAKSAFKASVGPVDAHIGMIPIAVAIPFLRRKRGPRVVVATVGAFEVHLNEVTLQVEDAAAHIDGMLGDKGGIGVSADATMHCDSQLDVDGKCNGSKATITVALNDENDENDEEKER